MYFQRSFLANKRPQDIISEWDSSERLGLQNNKRKKSIWETLHNTEKNSISTLRLQTLFYKREGVKKRALMLLRNFSSYLGKLH